MKFPAILAAVLFVLFSTSGYCQTITLKTTNASLESTMKTIEAQSGYFFLYNSKDVPLDKKISLTLNKVTLEEALNQCFKDLPVSYKIIKKNIVLKRKEAGPATPAPTTALFTVTGTVTGEKGPLQGVDVRVKGTPIGTVTAANGAYAIKALEGQNTLTFSSVGYETQEVPVNNRKVIDVQMKVDLRVLSDVVIIGYGSTKRADLTGAVGSVNMRDFEKAPVKSFDQALAGRLAGVQVTLGDGQPGTTAAIVIRGAGSISQDNSPLYVIDGFPMESSQANAINPSDIESIDVLKDASATAIYGARGSNGVVLITTKRGKVGPPKVTYNSFYGLTKAPQKIKVMNGYEYVKLMLERDPVRAGGTYLANGTEVESYRNAESFDWQDYIYQTGTNQNHDLAIRGGADKTTYSVSLNYNNQEGVIKYSGFKRYQGRLVLDQTVSNRLKAGVNSNYSYTEAIGLPVNATNFYSSSSFLYSVWGFRPVATPGQTSQDLFSSFYDPENDNNAVSDYRVNPVINLANQQFKYKTTFAQTNAYAEYSITPKLKLRVSGGFNNESLETNIFNNSLTQSGSKWFSNGPNGTYGVRNTFLLANDNTLTYRTTWKKKHNLTLLGGYSTQSYKFSNRSMTARQIADESLGLDALDMVPAANTSIYSSSSTWKLQSYLVRAIYDYQGKYLLTASCRWDGSSKFAPGNRWGSFPSASAGWRFSSEKFLKQQRWLSNGKLRVGYGTSGNNRVSDFAYASQGNLTNILYSYSYNNQPAQPGFVITAPDNPNLKWETSKQTNIGLDLGFFKNRIEITADVYQRVTKDLLLDAFLPYASGILYSKAFKNVGSLQNRGLEFTLNTINIQNRKFTWTSNFNISFNRNKVLSLTEGTNALTAGAITFFDNNFSTLSPYISVVGGPVGQMYGLIFDGVYQYADFDVMPNGTYLLKPNITTNGSTRTAIRPGDIKYKDLNGDLQVNASDYTIIGRGLPIHTGGFSNNFTYGNWDLNIFFQWSYGNNIINANRYIFEGGVTNNYSLNQFASYEDRWTPTNPSNKYFRVGGMGTPNYSSRVVEDGSYLRLKTFRLGYSFADRLLKKIHVSRLNINVAAQNILTFTRYSGLDPEASARQTNLTPGFDYGTYPQARTLVFGLNAIF